MTLFLIAFCPLGFNINHVLWEAESFTRREKRTKHTYELPICVWYCDRRDLATFACHHLRVCDTVTGVTWLHSHVIICVCDTDRRDLATFACHHLCVCDTVTGVTWLHLHVIICVCDTVTGVTWLHSHDLATFACRHLCVCDTVTGVTWLHSHVIICVCVILWQAWPGYIRMSSSVCVWYCDRRDLTTFACHHLCVWYCDRRDLATFACHKEMEDCYNRQDIYVSDMKNFACKHHYLVSTIAQPGVYNSPFYVSTINNNGILPCRLPS